MGGNLHPVVDRTTNQPSIFCDTPIPFHLDRLTGSQALLGGWAVWLVCLFAFPVTPLFRGTATEAAVFGLANLALLAGLSSYRWVAKYNNPKNNRSIIWTDDFIDRRVLPWMLVLGACALAARIADYFILRGIPITFDPIRVRQLLEQSSPNFASAIYISFNPATYAAGIIGLTRISQGSRSIAAKASVALLCCAPLFSVLYGGRSVVFLVVALILFTLILTKKHISLRFAIGCIFALSIVFLTTMFLFLSRIQESGLPLHELIQLHSFSKHVPPTDGAINAIRNASPIVSGLMYYAMTVGQYILHGVFEFFVVLQQKNPSDPLLLGRHEFDLINRIWTAWTTGQATQPGDVESYNPRSGVFTTFWGPAYLDFGVFMVPYAFAVGVVASYLKIQVQRGDILALPLYTLFIVQIAISPWVNGFAMASASYLDLGLFLFWVMGRVGQPSVRIATAASLSSTAQLQRHRAV